MSSQSSQMMACENGHHPTSRRAAYDYLNKKDDPTKMDILELVPIISPSISQGIMGGQREHDRRFEHFLYHGMH